MVAEVSGFSLLALVAQSEEFAWMPKSISSIWQCFVVLFLNFSYFILGGRWNNCVSTFDKLGEDTLKRRHFAVGFLMTLIFLFYLVSAYILIMKLQQERWGVF